MENNKNTIFVTLTCLFILYLSQALFLFIKNLKLNKKYTLLLTTSDKHQQEITKYTRDCNVLSDGVLSIQELAGEYFTHYIHQLVTRGFCFEDVDLVGIIAQVKKFFSYQITKRNLDVCFEHKNTVRKVKSDREIIFVILLNLIFKAIYRAKISSKIEMKVFQDQHNHISLKIIDTGYEYHSKLGDKIQMYELPKPIFDILCRRLNIDIDLATLF